MSPETGVRELIDLAAAAEQPGPLSIYLAAACRASARLGDDPELGSGLVLAALMSESLARFVVYLERSGFGPCGKRRVVERLAASAAAQEGMDDSFPFALNPRLPRPSVPATSRWLLPEEMGVGSALRGGPRPPSWAGSFAVLAVASLRLAGLSPAETAIVGCDDGMEVAVARLGGRLVWLGERKRPRCAAPRYVLNDAGFVPVSRGSAGAEGQAAVAAALSLLGGSGASPGGEGGGVAGGFFVRPAAVSLSPEQLSLAARRHVFEEALVGRRKAHVLALYAHQTLLVHRLEAYAAASIRSSAVQHLARRAGSVETLLGWMRRELGPGSIFSEPDRIMLAHQVLEYGVGRPLDRALFIFAVAHHLGARARVVQTTRGTYVAMRDHATLRIVDSERLLLRDAAAGVMTLAFDAERQYGLRDVWDLAEPASPPRELPEPSVLTVA